MKHHFQRSFSASQYYYHLFQVRILILGRTNTLSVIPQLNVKAEILEPKPFWPQSLRSAKTQKRLLPRGMISRTRNAPYLRKHQDFAARFLHRNTISAMYLKVSATGCWECKLEGKVTWGLVMGSLFRTVSEQGPTSDSFVRQEGDARGQRRSHFKRSTPRKEESRSGQNNTSSISPDPSESWHWRPGRRKGTSLSLPGPFGENLPGLVPIYTADRKDPHRAPARLPALGGVCGASAAAAGLKT